MRIPVPITAYALSSGLGLHVESNLEALRAGRRGLRQPPIEVPFETVTGTLPAPPPPLPARYAHMDSRTARIALAGYGEIATPVAQAVDRWGPKRVALILGTSTGGIDRTESAHEAWWHAGQGEAALPAGYDYPHQHPFHAFAHLLALESGIQGPTYVVSTACSSSAKVFASARRLMELDLIDAALVGGVPALCHTTVRGFHGLGVMASTPSRPFGENRPGMNVGEGAAYLLLERDGDPLALLRGVGETSDAYHMSSPQPKGLGARAAMEHALAEAGIQPDAVDYINAHGTGTRHNDGAESAAISALFGDQVPVVSTKAYTGHTLGACGGVEAILSILSMRHGFIPAAVGSDPVDPAVTIHLPAKRLETSVRYALSNAFAFGGNNCSVLLERP